MSIDMGTGMTITTLQQRLAELEAREEQYRLAVESSGDGMWDWNVATGDVYYSPRWYEVLGYHPTEIEPNISTWERLLHPDDAPHAMAALNAHLANQTTSYEAEFRLKTASGTWLWMLERGNVVARDDQRQPLRVIGLCINITERTHAEQRERAKREEQLSIHQCELDRAHAALNQSGDAIYWSDKDGLFIYVNQSACTQLGYTPEELLGNTVEMIDPSYTQEDFVNSMTVLAEHGTITFQTTHRRKDGSTFPVEIVASQIELHDDVFVCTFVRDITERKKQEEQLHLFQLIVEHAPYGIGFTDAQGIIVYSNPAHRALFGYGDEIIGMPVSNTVAPEEAAVFEAVIQDVLTKGNWRGESVNRHKDGHTFPAEVAVTVIYNSQGEYQGMVGFLRDITERKKIEAEIQYEKTFIEKAFNSLPDVFYVLNADGNLVRWNDRTVEVLGYTAEEINGMNALSFFSEDDRPPILAAIQKVFAHGVAEVSSRFFTKHGIHIPYYFRGSHIVLHGQSFLVGIGMDITERIRAEQEREALQQEIIAVQQNAIRELSTPLLPIADHVLALPLIGTVDSRRAQQVMEDLLEGIASYQADVAIVDITGVRVVDTQVAQAIIQTAQAVRLLGAQVVLTGIQPQIAQTLVQLGADMSSIITRSTLQAGIAYALERVP